MSGCGGLSSDDVTLHLHQLVKQIITLMVDSLRAWNLSFTVKASEHRCRSYWAHNHPGLFRSQIGSEHEYFGESCS